MVESRKPAMPPTQREASSQSTRERFHEWFGEKRMTPRQEDKRGARWDRRCCEHCLGLGEKESATSVRVHSRSDDSED